MHATVPRQTWLDLICPPLDRLADAVKDMTRAPTYSQLKAMEKRGNNLLETAPIHGAIPLLVIADMIRECAFARGVEPVRLLDDIVVSGIDEGNVIVLGGAHRVPLDDQDFQFVRHQLPSGTWHDHTGAKSRLLAQQEKPLGLSSAVNPLSTTGAQQSRQEKIASVQEMQVWLASVRAFALQKTGRLPLLVFEGKVQQFSHAKGHMSVPTKSNRHIAAQLGPAVEAPNFYGTQRCSRCGELTEQARTTENRSRKCTSIVCMAVAE